MTKELYSVDTLVSTKYNKTLETLLLHLYECIQLLKRFLFASATCYICHSTLILIGIAPVFITVIGFVATCTILEGPGIIVRSIIIIGFYGG